MLNFKIPLTILMLFICGSISAQVIYAKPKTPKEPAARSIEFEDAFITSYAESKDLISNSPMTENITSKKINSIGDKKSKYKAVKSNTPIYRFDTCKNCSKYMYFAKVGEEYYKIIFVDDQAMMDTSAKIYKDKKGNLVSHENVWASKL